MSQRKYLRSIARHNMEKAGIEKINHGKFALNWRSYITKGLILKKGDCRI